VSKSNGVAVHMPDYTRSHKMLCGQDRVTPLGPLKMSGNLADCTCGSCRNLATRGANNRESGGDWLLP
jgi:hypothetical protein